MGTATKSTTKGTTKSSSKKAKASGSNGSPKTGSKKLGLSPAAELKAAKVIGETFIALESKKQQIKDIRKDWRLRIDAAQAALRGAIESDEDGTQASIAAKLTRITTAWQEVEEAEAGRKSALSIVLEERKELDAKLRKQIEGAKQLDLFD